MSNERQQNSSLKDSPAFRLLLLILFGFFAFVIVGLFWMERAQKSLFRQTIKINGSSPEMAELKELGWVPEAVPSTVTDFYEAHDQDTNAIMMRFDLVENLDQITSGVCFRTDERQMAVQNVPRYPAVSEWWPAEDLQARVTNGEWPVYHCSFKGDEHSFWLAVSEKGAEDQQSSSTAANRIYMWTTQ